MTTRPSERPGRGFLHKNRDKLSDKSPDARGKVLDPNGVPMSAAIFEHEHGFSIDLRPWRERTESPTSEEVEPE